MTQCYDEGTLRAYLDGEGPEIERAAVGAHITSCAACRTQLATTHALAAQVAALLPALAAPPDRHAALERLQTLEQQHLNGAHSAGMKTEPQFSTLRSARRSTTMQISTGFWSSWRRSLLAGLATVVVIVSLLALPPVRAAADQLLQVFRVRTVMFIPTSPERIRQLESLDFDKNTLFVSKPTTTSPSSTRAVGSADEASSALAYTVKQPSSFPSTPTSAEFVVHGSGTGQFQINVETARQLLALMDVNDVELPDALGSAPIVVEMPASVEARYHGADYDMTLFESPSPTVTLPDGVELSQLGEAALRLLGMDRDQAAAASRQIDWNSTLLFPFPADTDNIRQVTVGETPALLVGGGSSGQRHWQLYWQGKDQLYMLEGHGHMRDATMIDALITTAESVR
jgi:putative zinc finger protein